MPRDHRVSVILPVRNGGAWLTVALNSVLENAAVAQVVVVDDGSTDGAVEVAVGSAADSRVDVVSLPETGLPGALNAGLEVANHGLIARMDADDVSCPGRIDEQVALWEQPADENAVVGCQVRPIAGRDGKEEPGPGFARFCGWQNTLLTPVDHRRERFIDTPITHPTMLASTRLLRDHGGWRDGPFQEDYDLFLRLIGAGVRLHKLAKRAYWYRDHGGRFTRTDARCSRRNVIRLKAGALARDWPALSTGSQASSRAVQIIGAGDDAKRTCDALRDNGIDVARFFDVNPRRIGAKVRGVPVVAHSLLSEFAGSPTLVAIVRQGARQQIRAELTVMGWHEGRDWLFVA